MVDMSLYMNSLNSSSIDELITKFQSSCVPTNRDARFWVDWKKVIEHAENHKIELALMNSLIGSSNVELEFRSLIREYPETLRSVPILLAIRDLKFPVIADFEARDHSLLNLDFKISRKTKLSDSQIDEYLDFMKSSGLFVIFEHTKNLYDYVLGVEVGMDTHARKNRSGKAMENLLDPILTTIAKEIGAKLYTQKPFKFFRIYGKYPKGMAERTADYVLQKDQKFVNIEVNFYSGAGSKPEEIIPSYTDRQTKLNESGWNFIWVTDGKAWKGSGNQLTYAFTQLEYVLNIDFIYKGLLKDILKKVLQ